MNPDGSSRPYLYGYGAFPRVSHLKALRITRFGDPDVLRIEEVPDPSPAEGQALVRVRAAGVNRADLLQRAGHYPPPPDAPPDIPGLEFAGEIASLGSASTRFAVGQRVFGLCSGGAQAAYLAVDCGLLVPTPPALDDVTAAGIAEAYVTAHDALVTQAHLRAGERVLVHAVGSSVGIAVMQIASAKQCDVYGTSRSAWKLERARALGLRYPIQADAPDFAAELLRHGGADVLVDFVGAPYFERNLAAMAPRGRMVSLATMGGANTELSLQSLMRKRLHLIGSVLRSRSLPEKIAAIQAFELDVVPLLAADELRVPIDKVFPLEEAAAAHRYVESNENFGKVILRI